MEYRKTSRFNTLRVSLIVKLCFEFWRIFLFICTVSQWQRSERRSVGYQVLYAPVGCDLCNYSDRRITYYIEQGLLIGEKFWTPGFCKTYGKYYITYVRSWTQCGSVLSFNGCQWTEIHKTYTLTVQFRVWTFETPRKSAPDSCQLVHAGTESQYCETFLARVNPDSLRFTSYLQTTVPSESDLTPN